MITNPESWLDFRASYMSDAYVSSARCAAASAEAVTTSTAVETATTFAFYGPSGGRKQRLFWTSLRDDCLEAAVRAPSSASIDAAHVLSCYDEGRTSRATTFEIEAAELMNLEKRIGRNELWIRIQGGIW